MVDGALWADGLTGAERAALSPGLPDDLDRRPDVLVVGGGLVGLATAVACRRAGLGRVVVLERADRLASGASGGNGGAIAPDMHVLTDSADLTGRAASSRLAFVALGRASLARYRAWDAEWDGALGLRTTRWLRLFTTADRPPALPAGPRFERLDADAVAALEPDLVPPDDGPALLVLEQGAVNPQRAAAALATRAGTVATGVTVTGAALRGGRIAAVHTSHGEFHPGAVVMATGLVPQPWSRGVAQRWLKGHMLAVAPGRWRLTSVVSSPCGGGARQPGGQLVCGGTFDDGDQTPDPRPEVLAGMLADLHRILPATAPAPVTHSWCCFRPVVDGRQPVIDRLPGTDNGWLSAGHFTTGVMMAAGTGEALADWIGTDRRPPGLETFDLPTARAS